MQNKLTLTLAIVALIGITATQLATNQVAATQTTTQGVSAKGPLPQEKDSEMFQRVLTLPGASIYQQPQSTSTIIKKDISVFTPYYVFERKLDSSGEEWVSCGKSPKSKPEGWIPAGFLETWKTQLVMQYAPRGQRERVIFFKDLKGLAKLVESPLVSSKAKKYMLAIKENKQDPKIISAIEAEEAFNYNKKPYLLPILEVNKKQFTKPGAAFKTNLVKVVSVNSIKPAAQKGNKKSEPTTQQDKAQKEALKNFKTAIVFVIDTTRSMGPYIDKVYSTVNNIYTDLEKSGDIDRVTFGLVAYRDDVTHNSDIEYVTRIYQPLDPKSPPQSVLENLKKVKPATVATEGWDEDAFAGIHTAVKELNWSPFDARIMILITDAGARTVNDEKSALFKKFNKDSLTMDMPRLQAMIQRKKITLMPMHMKTTGAAKVGNVVKATKQYQQGLGKTGDTSTNKYLGLNADSNAFSKQIAAFSKSLQQTVHAAAQGEIAKKPKINRNKETELGDLLVNEIFRAQLEYLGQQPGVTPPKFYRSWASDRDLVNPQKNFYALDVKVFLTRNQLNNLAKNVDTITIAAKNHDIGGPGFFKKLRLLAAGTSLDPNRDFDTIGDSTLMPSFLKLLPYKSRILRIRDSDWANTDRFNINDFIFEMESKLRIYRDISNDKSNWVDFGAGDPGLEAYPISLEYLP